jgi:putative DNA primase/helicase
MRGRYLSQKPLQKVAVIISWQQSYGQNPRISLHGWSKGLKAVPETIRIATEEYKISQDVIGLFLTDTCTTGRGGEVKASDLYHAYKRWCVDNRNHPCSNTNFGRRIEEKGVMKRRDCRGVFYLGMVIQDMFEDSQAA